jgi:hypothetical protein
MHDAGRVSGGQRVRQRDRDPQHLAEAHPVPGDEGIQGPPGHELHHDEVDAFGRLDLVDRDDIRVVEGGGGAGFLDEAGTARSVREPVGRENLDGDVAAEPRVAGAIDLAHSACADGRDDLVRTETAARGQRHEGPLAGDCARASGRCPDRNLGPRSGTAPLHPHHRA